MNDLILAPLLNNPRVTHIYVLRDFPESSISDKVTYITPSKDKGYYRHIQKLFLGIKTCKKNNINCIIGTLIYPHGIIGRLISIFCKIPYIHMTVAGHREFWMHGPIIEKINLFFIGSGEAITVTGNITKDYLCKKNIKTDKIFILPNIPNIAFSAVPFKKECNYDIVSLCRIDKNKNLILLIKAIHIILKKYKIRVAIAGTGDQLETIKRYADSLSISEHIDFLGYIPTDNKIPLLSNSKIFVSCSKGEGFPVALIEAMCCGCVPVASNVGDIADIINNGQNGFIFNDTDDENELACCLEKLLSNEKNIIVFRQNAQKISKQISATNNSKIWDNIFTYIS